MPIKVIAKTIVLAATITLPFMISANEELAKTNNCLVCHTVDNKIVGPSYKEVAAKYKEDDSAADMLVAKVMKGGSGNWGEIPMPPNPTISEEDARTLVEWVLSLQN